MLTTDTEADTIFHSARNQKILNENIGNARNAIGGYNC